MASRHAGPPYQRYTGWPNHAFQWRISWDRHAHAYLAFGPVTSQAVCGHDSSTSTLAEDDLSTVECYGCMLVLRQLADRPNDGGG